MKNVVIIGAGRLGKGFVGETFSNSPAWKMTFIDSDPKVIDKMNENHYFEVDVHRADCIEHHIVENFNAYTWEAKECENTIVTSDLIVFVIYPEQIEEAIETLSTSLKKRADTNADKELSIIFITNKNHLMKGIQEKFEACLDKEHQDWLKNKVMIRDSIIRRSTDADSNVAIQIRTVAVLSLLIQKPLNVDVSDVEWFELSDHLEILKDVKVFIVNGPHAASAFMGHYLGYQTINEIAADPKGAAFTVNVAREIKEAILASFPITEKQLNNLSSFPKAKGEMVDFIYRVAYDPIRKLAKGDRLVGSALMCYEHDLPYDNIAKAIAYGLLYNNPKDERACELQDMIRAKGIEETLTNITGLGLDHPIATSVLHYFNTLRN